MPTELTVAVVAALSAVFGAASTGFVQLLGQHWQRKHERERLAAEWRRELFASYLRDVMTLPLMLQEAAIESNSELPHSLSRRIAELRAQLLLYAPREVRTGIEQVHVALGHWFRESVARTEADQSLPRDGRRGVWAIYSEVFREIVQPAVDRLADEMAATLQLR